MLYSLDNLKASLSDNKQEVETVVGLFLKYFPTYTDALLPAYNKQDLETFHFNIHKIKSNLYQFDVRGCLDEVLEIENEVKASNWPEKEKIMKIINYLQSVIREIKKDYPHLV